MFSSPHLAYEAGGKATFSTRDLEAAALYKSARQLEAVRNQWDGANRGDLLAGALRFNQRLWTVFQCELASPDHQLAAEVRANLLNLCRFVDRRTYEVLADPDPAALQILININRSVADGLSVRAGV